ncbi:hypothetical protein THRCLA_04491 [Thraustotheca clavata]|uniref:Uncharacterized protein n=1 Tax=Thraustotheca clavata TaxID=74557 RepID=A0A1V9ZZ18_9STRA|nr:hypothetical protein THRCLA_04491 [Thraustotheca clavata]
MHHTIYCTSGKVHVGLLDRCYTIVMIYIGSIVVAYLVALCINRPREKRTIHSEINIPMSFTAFNSVDENFSRPSILFCGYIMYTNKNITFTFDVKLWRIIRLSDPNRVMSPNFSINVHSPTANKISLRHQRCWHVLKVIGSLIFLCSSLSTSVAYIRVLLSSLTNDYGWAGFNTSTAHPALSRIINQQLLFTRNEAAINLTDPFNGNYMPERSDIISMYPSVIRRQLYGFPPLQQVITGLRSIDSCLLPLVFTQYCWFDFDKNYEMASTLSRQKRCLQNYSTNGAVYLESGLRNVWDRCWGDNFAIGITDYLQTTHLAENGSLILKRIQTPYLTKYCIGKTNLSIDIYFKGKITNLSDFKIICISQMELHTHYYYLNLKECYISDNKQLCVCIGHLPVIAGLSIELN